MGRCSVVAKCLPGKDALRTRWPCGKMLEQFTETIEPDFYSLVFVCMLIHDLPDADGSRCTLTFEETEGWLRATWRGYVDPVEAMRGAQQYLQSIEAFHCPYLLNDNIALRGPWFDSVEWLQQAWLPHAQRLGLRYVAHVVQADTRTDILTLSFPPPVIGQIELQLFERVPDAEDGLRHCQQQAKAASII